MSTDLSSRREPHVHTRVSLRQPLRCGFAILICSCLFAGAAHCRARAPQDVAEAARQERARKDAKKAKHVYTDEDLRHEKILTPEDQAELEAKRKAQPVMTPAPAERAQDANAEMPQLPLGDIARRYRSAKQAAQATIPYHLPFEEPVFAAPVPSAPDIEPPRPSFMASHPNLSPARPRSFVAPAVPMAKSPHRIDPFAPRFAAPVRPPVAHAEPEVVRPKRPGIAPPSAAIRTPMPLHTVTVQSGDTLWKIAQRKLGRGARWQELLAANPGIVDAGRIKAGMELVVPSPDAEGKDAKVIVKPGDTLWKIALAGYGRMSAWQCVAEANPEINDVNRIYPGQQLLLPFACKP